MKYVSIPTTNCFWLRGDDITTFSTSKQKRRHDTRPQPTAVIKQKNVNFKRNFQQKQRGVQWGAMGLLNLAIHIEYFGILFKDV